LFDKKHSAVNQSLFALQHDFAMWTSIAQCVRKSCNMFRRDTKFEVKPIRQCPHPSQFEDDLCWVDALLAKCKAKRHTSPPWRFWSASLSCWQPWWCWVDEKMTLLCICNQTSSLWFQQMQLGLFCFASALRPPSGWNEHVWVCLGFCHSDQGYHCAVVACSETADEELVNCCSECLKLKHLVLWCHHKVPSFYEKCS